jgi:hypothetical protein
MLLIVALFCLIVPNGIFLYWSATEFRSFSDYYQNKLALAFIIEAFMVMFLLAFYFAKNPPGRFKWYWFVVLSLVGGIGFSIPFYWWLNKRGIGDRLD